MQALDIFNGRVDTNAVLQRTKCKFLFPPGKRKRSAGSDHLHMHKFMVQTAFHSWFE